MVLYSLYLIWLLAGFTDFFLHRRSGLPQTSGVRESILHAVQLAVVGAAVIACLVFTLTFTLVALLAVLAVAHAITGYLDTLSADGVRRITPLEQHVHSVLDAMPWIFLGVFAWTATPGWQLILAPAPPSIWAAVIVPAGLLVGIPWLTEFQDARRAAGGRALRRGEAVRKLD